MKSLSKKILSALCLIALSACGTPQTVAPFPTPPASLMKPPVELSSLTLAPSTNAKQKPSSSTSTK